MRLIHTKSLELGEFFGEDNTPEWAILSHVWEAEEISYTEWNEIQEQPESERADFLRQKKGYAKIREFCSLCQGGIPLCHHLGCRASATCRMPETICCVNVVPKCQCEPLVVEWCWVDTCCIDKSSSAELSEAINSMFKWYEQSLVCIAYLSDVPEYGAAGESSAFRNSTWFTRGWTLQELIAPAFHGVNFYSWEARHTPTGRKYFVDHTTQTTSWVNPYKPYEMSRQQLWLCEIISQITKIPKEAIGPIQIRRHLHSYSIAERMSWASSRKTTRGEDIAYCLLGLFDLNMPLIYGEGSRKAFFRLQEEMLKHSYDHTLFLWQNPIPRTNNGRLLELQTIQLDFKAQAYIANDTKQVICLYTFSK
ncbi:Vegetative incompatibility HET-E-1 protein [Rutstroemia sp. NJR-2017a BBW]|nr:Vegetative incompatibility HET-E-1 protein [Rutstroemia sp. NJR-2017a BBW]